MFVDKKGESSGWSCGFQKQESLGMLETAAIIFGVYRGKSDSKIPGWDEMSPDWVQMGTGKEKDIPRPVLPKPKIEEKAPTRTPIDNNDVPNGSWY